MILRIVTDTNGIPHVYDASDHELEIAGFMVDYTRDTNRVLVALSFEMDAGDLALDLTGELLE